MNKPSNNRPNTISQPHNAASVTELSSEAMDDINSISAGEFSTIQPSHNKRGAKGPSLNEWDSLPPLEDHGHMGHKRESLGDLPHNRGSFNLNNEDEIEIDGALSFSDDEVESFNRNLHSKDRTLDDDNSQIVDIDLEMDGLLSEPQDSQALPELRPGADRRQSPELRTAQARYERPERSERPAHLENSASYQSNRPMLRSDEPNGFMQELPPFSAIDSNDGNQGNLQAKPYAPEQPVNNFMGNFSSQNVNDFETQAPFNSGNTPISAYDPVADQAQALAQAQAQAQSNMLPPFVTQRAANQEAPSFPNRMAPPAPAHAQAMTQAPYAYAAPQGQNQATSYAPAPAHAYAPAQGPAHAQGHVQGQAPASQYASARAAMANTGNDPFSDPAFLAAQTAKPSFYQEQGHKRMNHHNETNELGYVSPGIHSRTITEPNPALEESFIVDKEDVERRTKEIWGDRNNLEAYKHHQPQHTITTTQQDAMASQPNAQMANTQMPAMAPVAANTNNLEPTAGDGEQPLRLLNPDAPSTLINGYVYDLQNKSQAEVRSGLDRIIQKTSQAMIANQEARAHSNDGTILASDMFKGSRHEHNIAQFNRNHQVNTKISGLVASYNAAKNKQAQAQASAVTIPNASAQTNAAPVLHHSTPNTDISTVISQGSNNVVEKKPDASRQVPQSAFAGRGSKNYNTIMSDSHNRLVSTDNYGRNSQGNHKVDSNSNIDFSFGVNNSKLREPSSVTANAHTQITKFSDGQSTQGQDVESSNAIKPTTTTNIGPTVNIDSILMPASSSVESHHSNNELSSESKATNVDLSSFNFDIDKSVSNFSSSSVSQVATPLEHNKNLKDEIKKASYELDSLLPSLDDELQDNNSMPRCKLFDAPDLFESSQDNIKDEAGPLKIKPDFYTTSNDKPAIVDINPLETNSEIATKVDHKNLDMELPELKDDKSLHTFESLSGLKDLGQALRSLADSLQPPHSEDNIDFNPLSAPVEKNPEFKISKEQNDNTTIDAFSSLMASADERFGKGSKKDNEAKIAPQSQSMERSQPTQGNLGIPAPAAQAEPAAPAAPAMDAVAAPAPAQAAAAAAAAAAPAVSYGQSQAFMAPINQAQGSQDLAMGQSTMLSAYLMKAKSQVGQCQYLQHSGLDGATIERFNLGFDAFYRVDEPNINANYMPQAFNWQALIVPLNEDSFVAYNSDTILQNTTGEPERRYVGQGQCFNLNLLNGSPINKPLFICANELDALALESLGCKALALGIPYNVMSVLTCLQNLCSTKNIKDIMLAPCYLCLPNNNQMWQRAQEALVSAFQTLQLPLNVEDLTCSCPSIHQALVFNKTALLSKLMVLQASAQESMQSHAALNIAPSSLSNTNGLVLSLENLAKLELSNTLYALSSSSISLSRLVLASLIENKFSPLVYVGSNMQLQMLCSLLSNQQGLVPIANTPLVQLTGYKAKFLPMPWEMNLTKIDEAIRAGLQAQQMSSEGVAPFMIDTFGYDQTLCTSLAPRFAQLAMEFNTPFVVWCTQEQKNIFSGNAFQSIEMAQGSPNEIIFRTIDNACRLHMFSTGK
ncbi:hypothetical protein MXE38_07465 [Anaerobiospirillum sp. NML120448]|uniref:hypothetical protein n=1 Tax=Anaerobiospirillum sp. NML120448 TaxID=2932816 RepID=UPI001FF4D41D|nr:hypothetical protein [Anaerobiospirillum sp. NML120448]MCK0514678.1 hypothetical protein [Anaerobiospirillum sp. NML120448]